MEIGKVLAKFLVANIIYFPFCSLFVPGIQRCAPSNHYISGFALNVEGNVGNFDDDLGVIDVRMQCDDGEILDGLDGVVLSDDLYKVKQ